MGLFEPQHLIIILVIALVIFGPGKIGDLGGSLGRGLRDFKKAMSEPHEPSAPAATEPRPASLQTPARDEAVTLSATQQVKETA
jgi:sec-independent protein translocase protein TatA